MKFFHSDMPNAPVLSGTAGSMISVLDACLKDGFGLKSVTALNVAGGVATATVSATHSAVIGSTILVAGATPSALNGEQKVTAVTSTSVSFATAAADAAATGSITLKMAPLGWLKPFSGTNLAAYKASAPEATGCLLRVDDTGTQTCRVVGYESMSDITTGTGRFPLDLQVAGGMYWPKSADSNSVARRWAIFGDNQFFIIYVKTYPEETAYVNYGGVLFGFGDLIPAKSGDAYACAIFGGPSDTHVSGSFQSGSIGFSSAPNDTPADAYMPRSALGLGSSQPLKKMSTYLNSTQSGLGNSGVLSFPDPNNNGLVVTHVDVIVSRGFRGRIPGVYHTPQYARDGLSNFSVIDGTGDFTGKRFLALRAGTTSGDNAGPTFVDITGPWR